MSRTNQSLVECPACFEGKVYEDGKVVMCSLCNGQGIVYDLTSAHYWRDKANAKVQEIMDKYGPVNKENHV